MMELEHRAWRRNFAKTAARSMSVKASFERRTFHVRTQSFGANSARTRPRLGDCVPLYVVAAHRPALPASAELLGICRRSDQPLRSVGRRLDGARANPALQSIRHARTRFCSEGPARRGALVDTLALRPLARHAARAIATGTG